MNDSNPQQRIIRSFVRREGRLTDGQIRALEQLYPLYGVDWTDGPLDLNRLFVKPGPVVLDIGFGDGEALAAMAITHPEYNYLGLEVYRAGTGKLLRRIEADGISNLKVMLTDATEFLKAGVASASLAGVQLFFPDPWPKKRHHKRRMVQPEWLTMVADRLQPGGFLHMATDWAEYADWMLELTNQAPDFENPHRGFASNVTARPSSRFERRGLRKGHQVFDLILLRRAGTL
ncbi:tRNA (guanosine(46)-N7)-methyltransferase TrmB [Spiribacter sp. C176]|uniref:tRNA (guanine-N(7)-)-methyltransferase n=1 Tax=Spiribacter salilacus TaxID=2664894 RepID=A0A6N7QR84_9GAMM|nr:tRNA (guanosine(46)-N7)-methyltransferase TrmB [Spiribacter salilacus]MRH78150.1 tRNA (guanosine(46)-N7)-methyltransferase TrmB [Spiribacter salilacus]